MNTDLFAPHPEALRIWPLLDGECVYWPGFFGGPDADRLMDQLIKETAWRSDKIRVFGRWVDQPRMTAWVGDPDAVYSYSGVTLKPAEWSRDLLDIKRSVEAACETEFNSVLLNLYRDGKDSMGWHSDDEPELGLDPTIASVSFGAERRFCLKHRTIPGQRHEIKLTHGSLLLMRGPLQDHWLHSIPKTAKVNSPRLNLTFRKIK